MLELKPEGELILTGWWRKPPASVLMERYSKRKRHVGVLQVGLAQHSDCLAYTSQNSVDFLDHIEFK